MWSDKISTEGRITASFQWTWNGMSRVSRTQSYTQETSVTSVESKLGRLSLASLDFLTRAFLARVTILRDCSQSIQETLEETVHIKIIIMCCKGVSNDILELIW